MQDYTGLYRKSMHRDRPSQKLENDAILEPRQNQLGPFQPGYLMRLNYVT